MEGQDRNARISQGFARRFRLGDNRNYRYVYRRGKSYPSKNLVLIHLKGRDQKFGFSVSSKVGNAVTRNRARRVLRAALYEVLPPDVGGYDLVLVARGQTPRLKSTQVAKTLERQLRAAGLVQE